MTSKTVLLFSCAFFLGACSRGQNDATGANAAAEANDVADAILSEAVESVALDAIPALPEVVARIDGDIEIKGEELQKLVDQQLNRFRSMGMGADQLAEYTVQLRTEGLDNLVLRKLLFRAAADIEVTDADIEDFLKKNLPEGKTLADISKSEGIPEDEIRSDIRESLRVQKFADKQVESLPALTEEDLKAEYDKIAAAQPGAFNVPEQVRAAHILVLAEKDAPAEKDAAALEKIKGIRERALAGEDFGALAAEFSEDPGSKDKGGEYTFGRGRMVPEFEEAAFTQEIGVVGEPVRTSYGYHILKVLEKIEARTQTLDDIREDLTKYLENQRKGEFFEKFVKELREKASIETFLPEVKLPEPKPAAEERELPEWAK